jgi:general secretion pathway protein L
MGFGASHAGVLDLAGPEAVLHLRQRGKLVPVGRFPNHDPAALERLAALAASQSAERPQLVLRLPGGAILRKRLSLPAGARWHIEKLLGFELDRETPFARDEVYWAYAIRHHDRARAMLDVELIIVTRSDVDALAAQLRARGVDVTGIEVPADGGKPLFVPLQEDKRHHRLVAYRSLMAPAAAAVALAAVALVVPFVRLHFARSAAESSIAKLTGSAGEAAALRKAIDRLSDTATYFGEERRHDGPALAVLAAVTRDLPDDTYLTVLSLHSGHVTIQGLAKSTAKVVALLSKDPMFTAQAFDSPVVQDGNSGLESFTLSFALKEAGPS